MAFDVTGLPKLVDRVAYPIMVESYESAPEVFRTLCEVRDVSETNLYGFKEDVLEGTDGFTTRDDGERHDADSPGQAYTWQCKIHQKARKFEIPQRFLDSIESEAKLADYIARQVASWGEDSRIEKDDFVAGMFQKGTLTAGSLTYFDGSYPSNADPNPGVIYDALPWFDTAHTISGVSGTTFSNHSTTLALNSANLETALIRFNQTNARTERNQRRILRADTLVVPPQLARTAKKLLGSELEPGGSQNDINVHQGVLDLVVWDALTDDTDAWWLVQRSKGSGVVFFDAGMPVIETSWDADRKVWMVTSEIRYGAGVKNWRYAAAHNKAAA